MNKRFVCLLTVVLLQVTSLIHGQDNLAQIALNDTTFNWHSSQSNNIKIYYQEDSFAERHNKMLLRSLELSIQEVLLELEQDAYTEPLNVFYVSSREEMKRIIGAPVTGFAAWGHDAMFLVVNPEWRSFEKHEFAHVVTMERWGRPHDSSRWMVEGIAIHCDGWCREHTVNEVAYQLLIEEQLPSFAGLFNNYSELGEIRAGFYSASLICFLRDQYGMEYVRNIWQQGTGKLEELLDNNIETIEDSWRQYLRDNRGGDSNVDLNTIDDLGCG